MHEYHHEKPKIRIEIYEDLKGNLTAVMKDADGNIIDGERDNLLQGEIALSPPALWFTKSQSSKKVCVWYMGRQY